ncbi:hypothetical protein [Chryseobacterium sp. POL2]|uniref:hypothetical protein n=1 Tax=Chryseobacterium sp. POL2 TaxID=2713414 RepID=UPI0013E1117C|nr:hypothetical protein [Chryseobacterium sp. POL2]QIG89576.1 hypothetical protein G6R40_07820 [Chryseobacterium sp. POL2]
MKIKSICFSVLISAFAFAQESAPMHIQNMSNDARSLLLKDGYKANLETEGNPYLGNDSFREAKIGNNEKLTSVRYNASLDAFEFLQNGQMLLMGKEDWYSPIYFPDLKNTVILAEYTYKGKKIKGYLFEYINGQDVSAYRRISRKFKKGEYAASSFDKDMPNRFIEEPDVYYLRLADGKFVEFPKNKKKLIALFPDKGETINKNIKTNDFDFNTMKQIIMILNKKSSE